MAARRKKLTRADYTEYRGYFYRKVVENDSRCRVYEPDGTFICTTGIVDAPKVIDDDIERQEAKAS